MEKTCKKGFSYYNYVRHTIKAKEWRFNINKQNIGINVKKHIYSV